MEKWTELQRSLGQMEGSMKQFLSELQTHRDEARKNFDDLERLIKEEVEARIKSVGALKQDNDRARGAGWAILAILGTLASIVGGCVIAVVGGWIKVH